MLSQLRRLLVPIVAATLAAGGLGYAAVETLPDVEVTDSETGENSQRGKGTETGGDTTTGDDGFTTTADGDLLGDLEETEDVGELDGTDDPAAGTQGVTRDDDDTCPGFEGNHGDYVRDYDGPRNEAARSRCGMPENSQGHTDAEGEETETEEGSETETEDSDEGPGKGRGHAYGHDKQEEQEEPE